MDHNTEFLSLIHAIIETSTAVMQQTEGLSHHLQNCLEKIPSTFADLKLLGGFFTENPDVTQQYYQAYCQAAQQLLQAQLAAWSGDPSASLVASDRRFQAQEWSQHPFFQLLSQHYLLVEDHLQQLFLQLPDKDQPSIQRIQFLLQQYWQALSPENFFLTNPQLLKDTVDNQGLNLLRGLLHFLQDLQTQGTAPWNMPLADKHAFVVGKDLAITPGKIVYQNELIELIQYTPVTEHVQAIPLLIMPPWINKYYILDLRPENSLVRWLVEQGIVVFMISWRNPNQAHAHWGLSDYLQLGPIAAIDFIQQSLEVPKVSVLGFCIGGTLTSMLLAYYKAQGTEVIASATLLASLIDFSEPGELGVFIHEQQIEALENQMQQQGYLAGEVMAAAFNALRPGDLIWRVFVNRYLFGQSPQAFDLLFWNMDTTNMPAKMHSEYLRTMYLANDLVKPGKIKLNQLPLDVSQIDVPSFFVSTLKDHIAVWQSTYAGFQLLKGPKHFILGGSGHIAGIVNPPNMNKYGYYVNSEYPPSPEQWLAQAEHCPGSWWPEWLRWLQDHAGQTVPASQLFANFSVPILRDAPGIYVHE